MAAQPEEPEDRGRQPEMCAPLTLPRSIEALGLRYLDEDELRERFRHYAGSATDEIGQAGARQMLREAGSPRDDGSVRKLFASILGPDSTDSIRWKEFRAAADHAAERIDPRVAPVSLALGFNFLGLGAMLSVQTLFGRSLGLTASELGYMTAANALARVVFSVPAANLAERFGRRPLLILGPAIACSAFAGISLSTAAPQLIFCNAVAGFGGCMTVAGASLYLNDISTPRNRARTTAPLMIMAVIGFGCGPVLGGFLAEFYGLASPFVACSMGMGMAAMTSLVALPETLTGRLAEKAQTEREPNSKQWARFVRRPQLQSITAVAAMMGFGNGATPVTTILMAAEILGMGPGMIGTFFAVHTCSVGLAAPLVTKLSDKTPNRMRLIAPGLGVVSLAVYAQSMCTTLEPFMLLSVVGGIGFAAVTPNVTPYIIDHTIRSERAQALAMRSMAQDIGTLMGACTMGIVSTTFGAPFAMKVVAMCQGLSVLLCIARGGLQRTKPKIKF